MPTEILRDEDGLSLSLDPEMEVEYGVRVVGYAYTDANTAAFYPDDVEFGVNEIHLWGKAVSKELRRAILAEFGDKIRRYIQEEIDNNA